MALLMPLRYTHTHTHRRTHLPHEWIHSWAPVLVAQWTYQATNWVVGRERSLKKGRPPLWLPLPVKKPRAFKVSHFHARGKQYLMKCSLWTGNGRVFSLDWNTCRIIAMTLPLLVSEAYLSSSLWNDARARSLDATSYGEEGTTTEKSPAGPPKSDN